jgi:hypothetical protein
VHQAVRTGGATAGSGRFFRLDPFALPVRHADGGGAFILHRDRALVRRTRRGVAATLDVPVSAYRGVAVRMIPVGDEGGLRVVIELLHRDPSLSLPLVVADEPDEAAVDWIAWGKTLNLPLLVVDEDGTAKPPVDRIGGVVASKPGARRNRSVFLGRRSRFARRRKAGSGTGQERLDGREIIARD